MAGKTDHWKLGLFVVLGVSVGLAVLGWLGAGRLDQEVERFEMYFDEPVDGLTVGSEVRYRGMPIGSVSKLSAAPDQIHVQVTARIFVETVRDLGLRDREELPPDEKTRIERLAEGVEGRVLRAQIERNPLTGLAVINVDFCSQDECPMRPMPFEIDRSRTLLTRPSQIKGILANMESTLNELRRNLPSMIEQFQEIAAQVKEAIEEAQVAETGEAFRATLADLRRALDDLQLQRLSADASSTMAGLRGALDEVRALAAALREPEGRLNRLLARYEALGADVQTALREVDPGETAAAARRTLDAVAEASVEGSQLATDLRRELLTVIQTLDAIRRLAELLERDPGSVIHGKTIRRLPAAGGE